MLTHSKAFAAKMGLRFPAIIQAPMAGGVTTPELVAAVSNAGGLGFFATGYLNPSQVREGIKQIKQLTKNPFGVNIFIPTAVNLNPAEISAYQIKLNTYRRELGLPEENPHQIPQIPPDHFQEMIDIVLAENIHTVSFTFGLLEPELIKKLKQAGIYLIGTANTLKDAVFLEQSGVDALVAQGSEAGGHRGGFIDMDAPALTTSALITALLPHIHIPIIAAGGIMTAEDILLLLQQQVAAVQIGTAFLPVKESGAHPVYKAALRKAASAAAAAKDNLTVMTSVYSGKLARSLQTRFTREMMDQTPIPSYPIPHYLTKVIRVEAAKQGNKELMSLWCGENITKLDVTLDSAEMLLHRLWEKCTNDSLLF